MEQDIPDIDRWYTAEQVAQYVGVSTKQIFRWWYAGKLKGVQASPRTIRFKLADIDESMRQMTKERQS